MLDMTISHAACSVNRHVEAVGSHCDFLPNLVVVMIVSSLRGLQLVVNLVAVLTACAGAVFLRESPLTAVQMLWVNLPDI